MLGRTSKARIKRKKKQGRKEQRKEATKGRKEERCKERRTEAREEETQKARTIQTEAQHATCINLHELPSKLHGAVLARPVENQCGEYDLLRHDLSLLATVE